MKKKIHKIKEELENNFSIIGIVSSASSHKLSWTINNLLKINLQLHEDSYLSSKDACQDFAFYSSVENTIKLISNKSDTEILVSKLKNIDYFIKIENNYKSIEEIIDTFRNSKITQAILPINLETLSKQQKNIFVNI